MHSRKNIPAMVGRFSFLIGFYLQPLLKENPYVVGFYI